MGARTMAPGLSSTREMAVASRKRPVSPTPSDRGSVSADESASDFGAPNDTPRKPAKKKVRTTKSSTPSPKDDVLFKIPKAYRSEEGNALFSGKWWKEVVKRDAFWADLTKYTTKTVFQKRIKPEIVVNLNDDDKKDAPNGKKTVATAAKMTKLTTAKRTTSRKVETGVMADSSLATETVNNVVTTAPAVIDIDEDVANGLQADTTVKDGSKIDVENAEEKQQAGSVQHKDDLMSRALSDPTTPPEMRAQLMSIKEDQARIAKDIDETNKKNKQQEVARQKRLAKKEQYAAEKVAISAEETRSMVAEEKEATDPEEKQSVVVEGKESTVAKEKEATDVEAMVEADVNEVHTTEFAAEKVEEEVPDTEDGSEQLNEKVTEATMESGYSETNGEEEDARKTWEPKNF